eukprot:CAMPEP_0204365284 /NCGR_PEP_ID=MMETSP0469-20131031/41800_1 /ASSEMBLY_ACC=CAM_ASM_000384 /TAXON_ID=2969 /ORGANISM="Oxyrrhis marina" /LENGTH=97 /DNA_ID=CAMNT_0051354331 /DNA_START=180 /DNA_END=471 /DNA_ORIENTATION=+
MTAFAGRTRNQSGGGTSTSATWDGPSTTCPGGSWALRGPCRSGIHGEQSCALQKTMLWSESMFLRCLAPPRPDREACLLLSAALLRRPPPPPPPTAS